MKNNKIIESTDKCVYLGIPLHACTLNNDMSSSVRDFNRKFNNLLADFYLLIAIYYLYYLIPIGCLYMEINCLNYMIKIV